MYPKNSESVRLYSKNHSIFKQAYVQTNENLIGAITTKKVLKIECTLDTNKYENGIKIDDKLMDSFCIPSSGIWSGEIF